MTPIHANNITLSKTFLLCLCYSLCDIFFLHLFFCRQCNTCNVSEWKWTFRICVKTGTYRMFGSLPVDVTATWETVLPWLHHVPALTVRLSDRLCDSFPSQERRTVEEQFYWFDQRTSHKGTQLTQANVSSQVCDLICTNFINDDSSSLVVFD